MYRSKTNHNKFNISFIIALSLLFSQVFAFIANAEPVNQTDVVVNAEISETKPEVLAYEANNVPNRIITTFNGDTQTQIGFNWYTTDKFDDAKVWVSESETLENAITFNAEAAEVISHYGERDVNGFFIFADVTVDENKNETLNGYVTDEGKSGSKWMYNAEGKSQRLQIQEVTEYSYKALATGLTLNTNYYYQVGSEAGEKSPIGQFTTSGESGEAFTFIHYTDTQNAFWNEHVRNEATFGADTLVRALETVEDADFVLHTGDIVEIAEVEDEWVDLFTQSEPSFLKLPVAPVPGNHDEYGLVDLYPEKYNEHVNVPVTDGKISGGSYYSYDYNGVHFVIANTNDNKIDETDNPEGKALGTAQLEWIRQDVTTARENGAKWVVLAYHKPLYSKSYHSLQDTDVQLVREEFVNLIDELDIDLALQGHDHVISRTKSLAYAPVKESFVNARIDHADVILGEDNVEYYENPEGTVYVLPNTGGTKAYDDIYGKGLEHIKAVRPKLDWLTQEQLDHYNSLFAFGKQPQKDEAFKTSHSNNRDSSEQNFAVYTFEDNRVVVQLYQIYGDLTRGEERIIKLIDEFGIIKTE